MKNTTSKQWMAILAYNNCGDPLAAFHKVLTLGYKFIEYDTTADDFLNTTVEGLHELVGIVTEDSKDTSVGICNINITEDEYYEFSNETSAEVILNKISDKLIYVPFSYMAVVIDNTTGFKEPIIYKIGRVAILSYEEANKVYANMSIDRWIESISIWIDAYTTKSVYGEIIDAFNKNAENMSLNIEIQFNKDLLISNIKNGGSL